MGQVITLSTPAMDMYLYGDNSNTVSQYLHNQIQSLGPMMTDIGAKIMNTLTASYNFVTNNLIQAGLRDELSQAGLQVIDNYFQSLLTWEALNQANLTMQRWIMCQPDLKQLWVDQNIDGYSGSYTDFPGNGVGVEDYSYRIATTGVVVDLNDKDSVVRHFYEDLQPGDRWLSHWEKSAIMDTHAAVREMLATCEFDFTATSSEEPKKINR